jgi:diadenosine tetraphosphate (Ap4A) HIT family hydrolase
MQASEECPFCARVRAAATLVSNEFAAAFGDAFPVSRGHVLVVPRRHAPRYFELTESEQLALWRLVSEAQQVLDREHEPDGYNVGVNVGAAAGQTVEHVHVHVIPRYFGDTEDPRGGIRWVLPNRAVYWRT